MASPIMWCLGGANCPIPIFIQDLEEEVEEDSSSLQEQVQVRNDELITYWYSRIKLNFQAVISLP